MPLFEYRCLACQRQFELLVRPGATLVCPDCGASSLEKMLSMFAVSSEGTQMRSRERLGARQRDKAKQAQTEREFYKHDHHDD